MRTAFGSFFSFIIGLIIGALVLWIVGNFVVIPHMKTNGTNNNQTTQNQNNANNQQNQTALSTSGLASGFPGNVPIYQPATLAASTESSRGGNAVIYSASYTSSNPANDIMTFYKSKLSGGQWRVDSQSQNNGISVIKATNNNNEQLDVLITTLSSQSGGTQSGYQLAVTPAR